MAWLGKLWDRTVWDQAWPKSPAKAAGCVLLVGLVLAAVSVGSSAYIQGGLPPSWPRSTGFRMLIPACVVGIARLGWKRFLLFLIPSWAALIPGLIGFILIRASAVDIDTAFLWLRASLYLIYAVGAWGILLAIKGWREYFKSARA
jgi:hypothetical protein